MAQLNQGQDKVVRIPLIGFVTARDTGTNHDQRFVNCYAEILTNPTEAYNPSRKVYLTKRPGLKTKATPASQGAGRGLFSFNSQIIAVIGNTVYGTTIASGSLSSYGTLATSSGPVTGALFTGNETVLVLNDGSHLYTVDTNNVVKQIGDMTVNVTNIAPNNNTTTTTTTSQPTSIFGSNSGSLINYSGGTSTTTTTYLGNITVTTAVPHNLNPTDTVNLTNISLNSGYNGSYTVGSCPTTTTFTIDVPTLPSGTTSGATTGQTVRPCGLPTNLAPGVIFLDGYLFVMDTNANVYNCFLQDVYDWQPLSYLQAEVAPDGGIVLGLYRSQVVAFGEWTTEFFTDVGVIQTYTTTPGSTNNTLVTIGSPLQRTLGGAGTIPLGCAAPLSIVAADQTYYWIAKDRSGGHGIAQLEGANAKFVSHPPFDRLLDAEGDNLVNARCFHVKLGGHSFYVMQLTSRTLVMDITDGSWTEWANPSGGKFSCSSMCEFSGRPYMLDDTTGYVYEFSNTTYQDNGVNFQVIFQTNRVDFETSKRKFLRAIEVIGDQVNTTLWISFSNDDYQTWSTPRAGNMNLSRVLLTQLGSFRRRAFMLSHTDNTPLRLSAIDFNIDLGEN